MPNEQSQEKKPSVSRSGTKGEDLSIGGVSWLKRSNQQALLMWDSPETNSKVHRQFRDAHAGAYLFSQFHMIRLSNVIPGHRPHAALDPTRASTGVVWTTEQAYEHGFLDDPDAWANLGQGAPEVEDDIEGSFHRPESVSVSISGREYGM